MSISFPALLIYLLPGFLGLWVFKNIVQEDLDKRGESTQIAIALLLGISAIAELCVLNFALSWCPNLAEYFSPKALQATSNEEHMLMNLDAKFWVSYITLCYFALKSGQWCAHLREKHWGLTQIYADRVNKRLKRELRVPCESAMVALVDEMCARGYEPSLVKIYSLIGNRDTALLGWWEGYSESEKEVRLSLLECCDAATNLRKDFDLQTRRCIVNHASGIVVEFLDIDKVQSAGFEEYMRVMYRRTVHPRNE